MKQIYRTVLKCNINGFIGYEKSQLYYGVPNTEEKCLVNSTSFTDVWNGTTPNYNFLYSDYKWLTHKPIIRLHFDYDIYFTEKEFERFSVTTYDEIVENVTLEYVSKNMSVSNFVEYCTDNLTNFSINYTKEN